MMKKPQKRILIVCTCSLALAIILCTYCATVHAKSKKEVLNFTKITLKEGTSKKLKVKNNFKRVVWKSSNKKIAKVNQKGLVKATKKGTAKITAKIGKKKLTCTLKVVSKKKIANTIRTSPKPTNLSVITPTNAPTILVTPSISPSATPLPTPTLKPLETPGENWNVDKQSGSEEAFITYFKYPLKDYITGKGAASGKLHDITYPSSIIGEERQAYVYTPAGYSNDQTYPVLYLIHGIGCDRTQWISLQMQTIIDNMIADREVPPFIAVCPSVIPPTDQRTDITLSPSNIKAYADFDAEFSHDLQPYIQQHYAVSKDRKRTAVCGLSMGGMEALSLGFSHLEYFNYIGSFSAAPSLDTSLLTLKNSIYTPNLVMLSSGTADGTVGDNPKNYHETLSKNNVDHIWFQFPKQGHSGTVWQNGLVNFLKRIYRD